MPNTNRISNKQRIAVIQHITEACSCPFYARDASGVGFCFIKNAVPLAAARVLVNEPRELDANDWNEDCEGLWDNCTVLPLLYDYSEADVDPNARDIADDYNPFEDDDADVQNEENSRPLTNFTPPDVAAVKAERRAEEEVEEYSAESLQYASNTQFSVHQVDDPYKVKCDAILIPVNNLLEPMDLMLLRHCGAYLESARKSHRGPIVMGSVYPVRSPHPSVAARKFIYRGVVAGVQSVNSVDIEAALRHTLHLADASGVEVLAMLPMDYASFDVELTAQAQISTVHEFLVSVSTQHLKHIVLLIPDDATMEVYQEYHARIFGNDLT